MVEGVRKERNVPDRIARSLIQNEELFIQSLKIFANTSIVGSQGAQAGGTSGGPGGIGNYFRKDGDIVDGVFATRPSIATITDNEIDIRKITETNYSSKVFVIAETGSTDEIDFILGGAAGTIITGSEFPGQWLVIQPIAGQTITINNDPSGFGDPTASPRRNIRTPDGNSVVLQNEQSILLIFDSTSNQWNFLGVPGSGVGGPSCFAEKDSGDVSGPLTIVFDANRFCRMRAIGDTTITFDTSSMVAGKWYQLTVEILQDGAGGHAVTFADAPFENQITPIVFTAGNRYTSIRFYAYLNETVARIFAFEENQPFPLDFFDGFIQARLDTDQTANLNQNDHIEFDLAIATDSTIAVSTGAGQLAGLFTNFEIGHLYQCEVAVAVESLAEPDSEFSFQFFNVTKGTFFGSQARALAVSNAEFDSSLVIAKGFFVADAISDTIEVRIKSQFGVNSIKSGDNSAEQMSYVVIKDCGVAGLENLEGNIVPAPAPTGPDTFGTHHMFISNYRSYSSSIPQQVGINNNAQNGDLDTTHIPAIRPGNFVRVIANVTSNGAGSRTDIFTRVGNTLVLLGNIPAGATGFFTFPATQAFVLEDRISVTVDRVDAAGVVDISCTIEVDFSLSADKLVIGATARIGNNLARFANIISPPFQGSPTTAELGVEGLWSAKFTGSGVIKDMWHFGTAPAGTSSFEIVPRVNGLDAFSPPKTVPAHAGVVLTKFDDVDVLFNSGDLINWRIRPDNGAAAVYVIIGRIILF